MGKNNFLYYSNNIERDSYLWNMFGSMLNAFQSVIFLVVLTRIVDLKESGFFVIAYANANLFLNIGKYGMRNFQVSDVNDQFSFKEYKYSRFITTFLMIIVSIIYVVIVGHLNEYSHEKSMIFIWMCLFKAVDSIEDVYLGMYQQKNRLDISGKCLTLRMVATIIIFTLALLVHKRLLTAIVISTISTIIILVINISMTYKYLVKEKKISMSFEINNEFKLFKICFPLFVGLFLAFYIGNAPKYAIDAVLDDKLQAIYGFISMPVFMIGLLNNFVFNPLIVNISVKWKEDNISEFKKLFLRQIIIIGGIIALCEIGAYLLGIPVLSMLYNTNLNIYKNELMVLLLGGGFFAYSSFLVTILTIMRKQKNIAFVYAFVSALALLFSKNIVIKYEIMGAAMLYLVLMMILCVMFAFPVVYFIKKKDETVYIADS